MILRLRRLKKLRLAMEKLEREKSMEDIAAKISLDRNDFDANA
jgi:hypothetical protein